MITLIYLKVTRVNAYSPTSSSVDAITEDLASIEIGESERGKLYRILPNTLWKIKTSLEDDSRKSCSDKYCLSKLGGIDDIIENFKDAVYNILATDFIKG